MKTRTDLNPRGQTVRVFTFILSVQGVSFQGSQISTDDLRLSESGDFLLKNARYELLRPGWRKVLLQRIVLSDGTGIYEPINLFTIREIDTTLTYLPPLQANKKELPDF